MRLFRRSDVLPAVALTIAAAVVFSRPVARLSDYVRSIETNRGLQLAPALVILAFVFLIHQMRKRQDMRARALVSDERAHAATAHAAGMTRLLALGNALARSLELDAVRAAAAAHLPLLLPGRDIWVMVRSAQSWTSFVVAGPFAQEDREQAATAAVTALTTAGRGAALPQVVARSASGVPCLCFPMVATDRALGALGVSAESSLTPADRGMLEAAAALLAASVRNAELFLEVKETSVRDALTGCFNRTHALTVLENGLLRTRRTHAAMSVVMFDLDRFKEINDTRGHLCGDAVLAAVGSRLQKLLRTSDLKCRYGGEEFLILLPDTPLAGARQVAETIRRALQSHPVAWRGETLTVTASVGVAAISPRDVDALAVIARADRALYVAKRQGRNCVVADGDEVAPTNQREGATLSVALPPHDVTAVFRRPVFR